MATGSEFTVVEVGYMDAVDHINSGMLSAGEVGYISASIKSIGETQGRRYGNKCVKSLQQTSSGV